MSISRLIGRILFDYLTKTYPDRYEVFGLDRHRNISSRYQADSEKKHEIEIIYPLASDKLFQSAILESHLDLQTISRVNIEGTKNVFEARVHRIIFASSVRTVFGYLRREPYLSIYNDTFHDKTMLTILRKLTIIDDPPFPDDQDKGDQVYSQSKIIGEQMAKDIVKSMKKSIISVRIGWVNIDNDPGITWPRTVWFSYRDLCSFFEKAIEAPSDISGTYFAMSNNDRLWLDLDDPRRDLGYIPQDGAEQLE